MVSAALWSEAAGAELEDIPIPFWPMPGMELAGVVPEVPAQPARAMTEARPRAEMVRVFFMEFKSFKSSNQLCCTTADDTPIPGLSGRQVRIG
jgi:hypothetical protein